MKNNTANKSYEFLALFDGISTGYEALTQLGVNVSDYVSYEIDSLPRSISKHNHPHLTFKSDVKECSGKDYKGYILLGGSSCQDLSGAMQNRQGLVGRKSSVFFEYVRIWKEMGKPLFLFENVGSMRKEDEEIITAMFDGIKPIKINSKKYAPAMRNRYYWTNIEKGDIEISENARYKTWKPKTLSDIIKFGYVDRPHARALLASDSRPLTTHVKMIHRYWGSGFTTIVFNSKEHRDDCRAFYEKHFIKHVNGKKKAISALEIDKLLEDGLDVSVFNAVRYLSQTELEACQTMTEGYTSSVTRNKAAHCLGNGWTQIVIERLLAGEKD